jgi:hypothetical protein
VAWLLPYVLGLVGLFGAGLSLRWSHRPASPVRRDVTTMPPSNHGWTMSSRDLD